MLGQTLLIFCFSSGARIDLLRIVETKLKSGACTTRLHSPTLAMCPASAQAASSMLVRVKVTAKLALNWFVVSLEDEKTFATLLEELQSASLVLSAAGP